MSDIKPGATVYVIATCADTLKRGSGTCWFRENGGCPYKDDGKLEYCGERENVRDVFETKVENAEKSGILLKGISFGFSIIHEPVRRSYVGNRIFTDRAAAVEALGAMERERERKRKERKQAALIVPGQCGIFAEGKPCSGICDADGSKVKGGKFGFWIPVEQELPEQGMDVLVCYADGALDIYSEWHNCVAQYISDEIVAWMPLPEAYKPDKRGDAEKSAAP